MKFQNAAREAFRAQRSEHGTLREPGEQNAKRFALLKFPFKLEIKMGFVVDTAQMKAAEHYCDERYISYSEMMRNAGNAVAERIIKAHEPCSAAVLCGTGNNGGDGFVIAARLLESGFMVSVILVNGEPKTDCAREYYDKLPGKIVYNFTENENKCFGIISGVDIVVECVFGTGFHGELPEGAARLFKYVNECPWVRYAVDVPGGVNSDTGESDENCFRPLKTFMLAAIKKCALVPECRDIIGELDILDIGIPRKCFDGKVLALTLDSEDRECLPKRSPTSHKGTFGRLLNIAGGLRYCGAAIMSTRAALRTGAGLTTLAVPRSVITAVAGSLVESTFLPLPETADGFVGDGAEDIIQEMLPKMNAVMIGCGLGNSENTRKITEFVIRNAVCPIIIDADGINSISENINVLKERTGATIITPHPMEFSRISGLSVDEIQRDRIGAALRFSREYGVIVVLKGANTVITDKDRAYVNTSGNPALAKGGSGDVLCGMIGGLIAQSSEYLLDTVCGAVYCHGYAAELLSEKMPQACVLASDIIETLPRVYLTDPFNS